jgi:hypothetical protein
LWNQSQDPDKRPSARDVLKSLEAEEEEDLEEEEDNLEEEKKELSVIWGLKLYFMSWGLPSASDGRKQIFKDFNVFYFLFCKIALT